MAQTTAKFGIYKRENTDDFGNLVNDVREAFDDVDAVLTNFNRVKVARNTAAGLAPPGSWIALGPSVAIAANPFGAGVSYEVEAYQSAKASVATTAGFSLRIVVDAAVIESNSVGNGASGTVTSMMTITGSKLVTDGLSHTVSGQYKATGSATVLNDDVVNLVVRITPAVAL